jgi:hypothetical protein
MIDRTSLDPSLLAKPETRSHGTLVQEIARNQTRLGRLARAVAEPESAPDAASAGRLARLSDAQAVTDALGTARQFEIAAERLMSMSHLAAAARATDLAERTRDNAGRQFEALKWQALNALRAAAGSMRAAGAWQLHADPGQISLALTRISIATPDAAAAAASALNAALAAVETTRTEIAETAIETDEAEALDADELARRIAAQATKSAEAQANIAPGNARLLLS